MSSNGTHSAGVCAALPVSAAIPSSARRARPVCRRAAMMAPTIGAVRYSQASLKLPVATIGPSARAGLNGAPVSAPPMMTLKVSVIPIASDKRGLSLVGKKNFRDLVHAWIERRYFERLLQRRSGIRVLTHGFVVVDARPLGVHRHFRSVDATMQTCRNKARVMADVLLG